MVTAGYDAALQQASQSGGGGGLPSLSSYLGGSTPDEAALPKATGLGAGVRPYSQVGKMPLSLAGQPAQSFQPKAPPPAGVIPSVLGNIAGAVGGVFGKDAAKAAHDVAFAVGDVLDIPTDILSNLPPIPILPGGVLSPEFIGAWGSMSQREQQDALDQVGRDPLNALNSLPQAARASYEKAVARGMANPLHRSFAAPATSFGDQVMNVFAILGLPGLAIQRTYAGISGRDQQIAAYAGNDPFLTDLRDRFRAGEFGAGQQAHDRLLDELTAAGRGFTDDPLANMVLSIVTDPIILASAGTGLIAKGAKAGEALAYSPGLLDEARLLSVNPGGTVKLANEAGLFLSAFPMGERSAVLEKVVSRVATENGLNKADAISQINRVPIVGYRAMAAVAREYPAEQKAALAQLSSMQRWSLNIEPTIRPITDIVRKLNDPISFFGTDATAKAMNSHLSSVVTEGKLKAYDLDNVAGILKGAQAADPTGVLHTVLTEGDAVTTHNMTRQVITRGIVRDVRHTGALPGVGPEAMVEARLGGRTGRGLANSVEMLARRVMPQYLATGRGKAAEALADARNQAFARLMKMAPAADPEKVRALADGLDLRGAAFIDNAYFGHVVKTFVGAKQAAMNAGQNLPPNFDLLTLIGPRELTASRGAEVLKAIQSGDIAAVREAAAKYDLLFENMAEAGLSDADLLKQAENILLDPDTGKLRTDLVQDITDPSVLPDAVQQWLADTGDIGYRLGVAPPLERRWRPQITTDAEGNRVVTGVHPWLEHTAEGSTPAQINEWTVMRDRLFGEIRGERIVLEARQRFAEYGATNWGLPRGQSEGLFGRLMKAASEQGVTPRGMSMEEIYNTILSHKLPEEAKQGITDREAAEALVWAFEGRLRTVGVAQKFTGKIKTGFVGQGNFVGRVAERVYPLVRFSLNPLFQMQEALEPFILNIQRGIKPGFRPNEWDEQTLELTHLMMSDGRMTLDDQIERGDLLLWGEIATRQGFGPTTTMGKMLKVLTIGGRINIRRMKQTNYARVVRNRFGEEFYTAVNRTSPALWNSLVAEYGTADRGIIALRFMRERSTWANSDPQTIRSLAQAIKPSDLGKRTQVTLDDTARALRQIDHDLFGEVKDGAALRQAVLDGTFTGKQIKQTLRDFGADPNYAEHAARLASVNYTTDEFFDAYRATFGFGRGVTTKMARGLYQALADAQGITLDDYLARHFADVPMAADAADFVFVKSADAAALRLQGGIPERVTELHSAPHLTAFRALTRGMGTERALAYNPATGAVILEKAGLSVQDALDRGVSGAVEFTKAERAKLRGAVLYHNHPYVPGKAGVSGDLTFSSGDLSFASSHGLAEMRAESPGFSYVIRPNGPEWEGNLRTMSRQDIGMEMMSYIREWERDVLVGRPDISMETILAPSANITPEQWLVFREEQDYALQRMAAAHDFHYESTFDPFLSDAEWEKELESLAINPPAWLTQSKHPTHALSSPFWHYDVSVARPVGPGSTNVAFEVQPGVNTPNEATFGSLMDIPDPNARMAITAGMEEHLRGIIEDAVGVKIARAIPGVGGWQPETGAFTLTPNAVWTMADSTSREDALATMNSLGYLAQQDAVYGSVVKPGLDLADPGRNEHWALTIVLPKRLTPEEIGVVTTKMHEVAPGIAGWGSHAIEMADGRTGLRFIRFTDDNYARDSFIAQLEAEGGAGWEQRLFDALGPEYDGLETHANVVEALAAENDWKVNPNGEGYLQTLWDAGRHDLAEGLVNQWGPSAERRLAGLYQQHAPVEWGKRLASGAGDANDLDAAAARAAVEPTRALTDNYRLLIPGGEGRPGPFTYWEQMLLKSQGIRPDLLWQSDPLLVIRGLYKPTWRAKVKDPTDPLNVYNAMVFAGLSPRTNLTITEAAYSRARVTLASGIDREGALESRAYLADTYRSYLPPEMADTGEGANEMGRMFQLEHGYYRSVGDLRGLASAGLRDEGAAIALATRGEGIAQQLMADGTPAYEAYRLATKEVAKDAARQHFVLMGRSWASALTGNHSALGNWFVGTRTGIRAVATNRQWGHAQQWAAQMLGDSTLRKWIARQPGETPVQHAFRLASVVRGLDAKTGLFAMDMMGPASLGIGIIDTITAREIAREAIRNGTLDDLLAKLSPGYRRDMEDSIAHLGVGRRGNRPIFSDRVEFEAPRAEIIRLVSGARAKWLAGDDAVVRAQMRSRLAEVFPDPDERALYTSDPILRQIALNNDGTITRYGGDYAVMDEALTAMKHRESATLRARAGVDERLSQAADELDHLSNAEYQWLRWDRARGAYDPHEIMSDGVEDLPQMPDLAIRESVRTLRNAGFTDLTPLPPGVKFDPRLAMLLQKVDSKVLGATVTMDDATRIIVATQHADMRTGIHELAHVLFPDLDPSARDLIVKAYAAATGQKAAFGKVTRPVEEWFADQFVAFVAGGVAPTKELTPTFLYFRKWLGAIYTTIKQEETSVGFRTQRTAALHEARVARAAAQTAQRRAQSALFRAQRRVDQSANELRRQKARLGADTLARREADWAERETAAKMVVDQSASDVRAATAVLADTKSRFELAQPGSRGGLARSLRQKEVDLSVAKTKLSAAERDVDAFHIRRVEAGRDARAAARRTPITKWEEQHAAARTEAQKAGAALRKAEEDLKTANGDFERTLATREPKVGRVRPTVSPEMDGLFKDVLKPIDPVLVPKRHQLDAATFDPETESVYAAAEEGLLRAEEEAFTLHYYKRGRNWAERSINHPYFGLYPFSYMWGKMLPEMARFLVKEPFGVPAPFAGLLASQQVYRSFMLQADADPRFRKWVNDMAGAFQFGAMLMPAMPWDIPVNAPLWARRLTEIESMDRLRAARGQPRRDAKGNIVTGVTPTQMGTIASDVATYAFGPAYAFTTLGQAGGLMSSVSEQLATTLNDTVQSVFNPPPQAPPGAFTP